MINTPAFESLQRYKQLSDAIKFLDGWYGHNPPYQWMYEALVAALLREKDFMLAAKKTWLEELVKSYEA